jgi:hypothetical protein
MEVTVTRVESRLCRDGHVSLHAYVKEWRHWYCLESNFVNRYDGASIRKQVAAYLTNLAEKRLPLPKHALVRMVEAAGPRR